MKYYRIEPTYKKAVVDYISFTKDGVTATKELGWRWGEFMINVPETDEEILAWGNRNEEYYETLDDVRNDYGLELGEEFPLSTFLPEETDEFVDLDDYDYEMLSIRDTCWEYWNISSADMSEEDKEALIEELEEIYNEEYEEGIENAGWEYSYANTEIHTSVSVKECDDTGSVLDEET